LLASAELEFEVKQLAEALLAPLEVSASTELAVASIEEVLAETARYLQQAASGTADAACATSVPVERLDRARQ
jgi:hypothetical protein